MIPRKGQWYLNKFLLEPISRLFLSFSQCMTYFSDITFWDIATSSVRYFNLKKYVSYLLCCSHISTLGLKWPEYINIRQLIWVQLVSGGSSSSSSFLWWSLRLWKRKLYLILEWLNMWGIHESSCGFSNVTYPLLKKTTLSWKSHRESYSLH